MEEIIWIGIKDWLAKEIKICVGFSCCPLVNSKWFNANLLKRFTRGHKYAKEKIC
jgi:hypothetical protein